MSVYVDHAATTAVRPAATAALMANLRVTANPASLHTDGRAARRVLEESRELLARHWAVRPSEIIFTSGGTEADNLGIHGLFTARRQQGCDRILVSAVEHHAVLDAAHLLERDGATVVELGVDRFGGLDTAALDAELAEHGARTAVVAVMAANNEVGTIQPVADVVTIAARHGVPVHVDAVQAMGLVPAALGEWGATTMAVSGHKVGAPQGVGALVVRRGASIEPVTAGGGQERGLRPGTVPTALIAAFAAAVDELMCGQEAHRAHLGALRRRLVTGLREQLGSSVSVTVADEVDVLSSVVHVIVEGCEGDSLLYLMDAAGVSCSTGSACQAGVPQPSHVLLAMGVDPERARGALRFSLGWSSTEADVDHLLAVFPGVVELARAAAMAGGRA